MAVERDDSAEGILDPEDFVRHVTLRRFSPSRVLAEFVEFYWVVAWDLPAGKRFISENLPHPSVHVVFEPDRSYLQGVVTTRFTHTAARSARVFSVKFLPGMAFPIVGRPLSTFTDKRLDLETAFGAVGAAIEGVVAAASDVDAQVAALEDFLRDRLATARASTRQRATIDSCLRARSIVEWIRTNRAVTTVRAVETQFGVSTRSLQALFRQYVGVGPKWVIRRYRMIEAVELLHSSPNVSPRPDLAELALDLGYTDQSHFTNDFHAMTGRTPGSYSRSSR